MNTFHLIPKYSFLFGCAIRWYCCELVRVFECWSASKNFTVRKTENKGCSCCVSSVWLSSSSDINCRCVSLNAKHRLIGSMSPVRLHDVQSLTCWVLRNDMLNCIEEMIGLLSFCPFCCLSCIALLLLFVCVIVGFEPSQLAELPRRAGNSGGWMGSGVVHHTHTQTQRKKKGETKRKGKTRHDREASTAAHTIHTLCKLASQALLCRSLAVHRIALTGEPHNFLGEPCHRAPLATHICIVV